MLGVSQRGGDNKGRTYICTRDDYLKYIFSYPRRQNSQSYSHIHHAEIEMGSCSIKTMILIMFLRYQVAQKPLVERGLKKKYFKILVFGYSFI